MARKVTTQDFIEKAQSIHGDRYDYSKTVYVKAKEKVTVICREHGEFQISPNNHTNGTKAKGCSHCAGNVQLTKEEIARRGTEVHGDKYDYKLVEYVNNKKPVQIICKECDSIFEQNVDNHTRLGQGCPECNGGIRYTTPIFVENAKRIHGDTYDYSNVHYVNQYDKVEIICKTHGSFMQMPMDHNKNKSGCPKCANEAKRKSTEEFIAAAKKINGDLYDYSEVDYVTAAHKVRIKCNRCDTFFKQAPHDHISQEQGCPKCNRTISKKESRWLDSLGIPDDPDYRQVPIRLGNGKYVKVDGYDPDENTVYEFHGDWWHGNPRKHAPDGVHKLIGKSFGELYSRTIAREQAIKDSGYNLVVMWEDEWD